MTQPRVLNVTENEMIISSMMRERYNKDGVVGFQTGVRSKMEENVKIILFTEGVLLAKLINGSIELREGDLLILDEVHERTQDLDLILRIIKQGVKCKIIITSATFAPSVFKKYFGKGTIIEVEGVKPNLAENKYLENNVDNYLEEIVKTVGEIVENDIGNEEFKDILIFVPSKNDINLLKLLIPDLGTYVKVGLYRGVNERDKEYAFSKTNEQKIIIATNVAETGANFPQLKYVIDSGYSNINYYDIWNDASMLTMSAESKNQAKQRWGRAGRSADKDAQGIVYTMYTKNVWNSMREGEVPAVYKADNSKLIMNCIKLGYDLGNLGLIDELSPLSTSKSVNKLYRLGIIDKELKLTRVGELCVESGIDPKYFIMLMYSVEYRCVSEVCVIISMIKIGLESLIDFGIFTGDGIISNSYFSDHVNLYLIWKWYCEHSDDIEMVEQAGLRYPMFVKLSQEIEKLENTVSDLGLLMLSTDSNTSEREIADRIKYSVVSGLYMNVAENIPKEIGGELVGSVWYKVKNNEAVIGKVSGSYAYINSNRNLVKLYPRVIVYDEIRVVRGMSGLSEYRFGMCTAVNEMVLSVYDKMK
jgi:HrpA-like RNA helicase